MGDFDDFDEEARYVSPEEASRRVGDLMGQILAWRQKTEAEVAEYDRRQHYIEESQF